MLEKGVNDLMPEFPLKGKYVAMLAPSFIVQFDYPSIISRLKTLGFDKVVELTFGAKMINREYHKVLKKSKDLVITSPCPGIVDVIKNKFPQYKKNLAPIDSPMVAMAKISKRVYPNHKTVFISPCHYKKMEASKSSYVDFAVDYNQLEELFKKYKIPKMKKGKKVHFDKFYNDYTKIFPLSGGLAKTAHLKGVVRKEELKEIDGIAKVMKFLENPEKGVRFLDVLFCVGGCIGGPCVDTKLGIPERKKKVLNYLKFAKTEDIPESKKGLVEKAKGIKFTNKGFS